MQQRTSDLVRVDEDVVLEPKLSDPDSALVTERIFVDHLRVMAMPLKLMDRACFELRDCLEAAAVAAIDISSIPCRTDGTDHPYASHDLHLGSSTPTMLSFNGPDQLRPPTIEFLLERRDIFCNALQIIDAQTPLSDPVQVLRARSGQGRVV